MDSLRGQLLIASPVLADPNFRRTVVLVAEHGEEGAMGLVLTRPSPATVGEAVPDLEQVTSPAAPVFVGGPVRRSAVLMLVEFCEPHAAGVLVSGRVGFPAADVDLAQLPGVSERVRVFAGHAGWGPGQLEAELERSDWILREAEPDSLFSDEPETLWARLLEDMGGQFALLARMPLDPSWN